MKTPKQAAQHLNVAEKTLAQWRWRGEGPLYVRLSARCIRYQTSALDSWLADRVRGSTSDQGTVKQAA